MTAAQTSVLRLIQAMFDAAPNAAILDELSTIVENAGDSVIPLANLLAENPVFSSEMYTNSLSNGEFAQSFIDNIVGDAASAANKALAVVEVTALLDSGTSRGEVIALAADALGEADTSDPVWGAAALQFQNKVLVAGNYAIDQQGGGATFDTLQSVTQRVTSDPASVTEAIARFTESTQGVVVDGYVAGALVFVDIDGDGLEGPGHPVTTTDAQGNYRFTQGVENYGRIISIGGTDIATGQPFEGSLTAPAGSTVINPLTTLIDQLSKAPGVTVGSAKAQVLTALGLNSSIDLQNFDPIKTAADPNATPEQKALALKVQAAAAQVMTIVQQTAAVLKGTGTSADSNSASAAAFASLADAMSAASASAGLNTDPNDPNSPVSDGTLSLTSPNAISNIVTAAATRAGASASQQAAVDSLANDASTIITNLTAAIGTAVGNGTGDVTETLNGMARVQVVSGNTATAVQTQASGLGNISNAAASVSGDNLTDALDAAQFELGDVDGDGESNATTSSGGGGGGGGTPTTFTVTETAGVVEFGGTASGNITVSWAGTVGDSVATFSRGGVTATEEPDFNGTATTITLAAGQSLALSAAAATTLIGNITDIDGAGSVALTDNPVAAGDLNTLDTAITASVNASAAATITGTGAEFATAIGSANITLSGSYAATVTGTPSIADLNTIDGDTSGVVTATPATATLATLNGLTGSGNAYTLTINDAGTVAASDLTTLDGKTTVAINASSAATLSGTGAELSTALGSAGISTGAAIALSITGTITAAQQATLDGDTNGVITATISDGGMTALANLADANTNNALTVTVTDASADAGALITLDGKTSVNVDATAVTTLTGTGANISTVLGAGTIDTAAAPNATASDTISSTVAASLIGATGGTVTATVTSDTAANLDADLNGLTGALTLTATGVANAADLNSLDTVTAINITASAITSLTGTAAAILTTIGGAITLPADVAITVTGTPSIADLNSIDAATTGAVTATPAADSLANLNGLNGTGNAYTLTINDSGTVAATDLSTLDGKTTVAIDATSAATISGTGAELTAALASAGITLGGAVAVSVTGSISTADQATLDGNTTAAIIATISDGDLATLAGLADANTNNALTVTVTDTSADAAALIALDGKTTVNVDATAVTTLTGTGANIDAVLGSGTINTAAAPTVTVSDTISSTVAASIIGATGGTVTATVTSDTAANLVANLNGLTGALTLTATGAANAADLNSLDAVTAINITASAITSLTGTAAEVLSTIGGGITLPADVAITVTGTPSIADLNTIDAATTGVVTATPATDTLANLNGLNGTGNAYTLTINDAGTVAATDLNTLDGKTTVAIDATSAATISGTGAELSVALASAGITLGGAVAVSVTGSITAAQQATLDAATTAAITATISDGDLASLASITDGSFNNVLTITLTDTSATAAALNTLDGKTSEIINAESLTSLTGTGAAVALALTGGFTFDFNIGITLDAGSITAADLSTVETNTLATIDMSGITDVVLAASDSFSFDSVTVTGQTFNLNGTGDNGLESFTVNLNVAGATVDLSNITVDENDVTVTVNGNDGDDTITATSADDTITTGIGSDTIVFADTAANNGADTLSDFATGSDKLDFSAFETAGATVEVTGALTTTAGTVYYLTGSAAGNADSAAAAAAALSAAGIWVDANATAWIVISDDDSAAVYEWADTAASINEVAAGELTLVGTITGTVAAGDLMI